MAITQVIGPFLIGVGAIVDEESGAGDEIEMLRSSFPRLVFGIGHIGERLATIFEPVADGTAGMIERGGLDRDAGVGGSTWPGSKSR